MDTSIVTLGTAIVVGFITWLTKTKAGKDVFHKIPSRWRRAIPLGLGAVAGVGHFIATKDLEGSITVGLGGGALPMAGHEAVVRMILGKPSSAVTPVQDPK